MRSILLVAILVALPGCILEEVQDTDRPTDLVLRFTVVNEGGEGGGAMVGEHCAQASIRDGRVEVERAAYRELGPSRPFLLVLPELDGPWATTGTGGFVIDLPGAVTAKINDDDVTIGRFEWIGNATHGHAEVNGKPVTLPHTWTLRNTAERYRIDSGLEVGPEKVVTFDAGGPCA